MAFLFCGWLCKCRN